jgi:hypothetical protein
MLLEIAAAAGIAWGIAGDNNLCDTSAIGTLNVSRHLESADNEVHKGLYVECNKLVLGNYLNSHDHWSTFVGYKVKTFHYKKIKTNIILVAADNYPEGKAYRETEFLIGPLASFRYKNVQILAAHNVVVFGFHWRIK